MLGRLIHEPLAREIGQPLPTLPSLLNKFDLISVSIFVVDYLYSLSCLTTFLCPFHFLLDVVRGGTAVFLTGQNHWSQFAHKHQIFLLPRVG